MFSYNISIDADGVISMTLGCERNNPALSSDEAVSAWMLCFMSPHISCDV